MSNKKLKQIGKKESKLVRIQQLQLIGADPMKKEYKIKEEARKIFQQLEPVGCAGDESQEFGLMSQDDVYWALERAVKKGTEMRA